jgi:UDP-N-acetylglucosamine:LPS N-acetylglucosamine transferase
MIEALPLMGSDSVRISVVWICGTRELASCRLSAETAPVPVNLFDYLWGISDARGECNSQAIRSGSHVGMADALTAADVVVMRAGASSVAEVLALGKPSVLVPYPHAADDHQTRNALALVREGAAMMIPEQDLTGAILASALLSLAADSSRRTEMSRRAASLGRPGAAREVAIQVLSAMGGAQC